MATHVQPQQNPEGENPQENQQQNQPVNTRRNQKVNITFVIVGFIIVWLAMGPLWALGILLVIAVVAALMGR